MNEGKTYKNTRTGEISVCIKIWQKDWDHSSPPEKIKDFFTYMTPNIKDIRHGDILVEVSNPLPN